MAISRQKEARSRDYALLLFRLTLRVLYNAQYHGFAEIFSHSYQTKTWDFSLYGHIYDQRNYFIQVNNRLIRISNISATWLHDICITIVQCWINVEDVGPSLYKCNTSHRSRPLKSGTFLCMAISKTNSIIQVNNRFNVIGISNNSSIWSHAQPHLRQHHLKAAGIFRTLGSRSLLVTAMLKNVDYPGLNEHRNRRPILLRTQRIFQGMLGGSHALCLDMIDDSYPMKSCIIFVFLSFHFNSLFILTALKYFYINHKFEIIINVLNRWINL